MKPYAILLTLITTFFSQFVSSRQRDSIPIVPQPVAAQLRPGYFHLNEMTRLVVAIHNDSLLPLARRFSEQIRKRKGVKLRITWGAKDQNDEISLLLNHRPDSILGSEGYRLSITPRQIFIRANRPAGIFYGLQSLRQVIAAAMESPSRISDASWQMPCMEVVDYPRFGWRGLMLDVSRHFFSKLFIEQYLDEMARYKFNVFHWHLTDDNGWRIQINGLPRLTEKGAWRVSRTGKWGSFSVPAKGESSTYGGYYTQEDIREIVSYAQERFITIVPEIDVPGHSLALIASYPNLSCTKIPYAVNPGSHYPTRLDNVLCVANDSTWVILNKIFTQVAELFPGPYIHIGGDEAYHGFWADDPRDSALMVREHLHGTDELQSFFVRKVAAIIASEGKKVIGWDEIVKGGLAKGAAVMTRHYTQILPSIRADQPPLVLTTGKNCYLDYYQGDSLTEPEAHIFTNRLSDTYDFDPVPPGVSSQEVLGGEGCLWTENVPNTRHAQYMTWPRAIALAEVLWSTEKNRNWERFVRQVEIQFDDLNAQDIKHATSMYDPIVSMVRGEDDSIRIRIATEVGGLDLFYSFDGTDPDNFYPKYERKLLSIPKGATEIRVVAYRTGQAIGKELICPIETLKERVIGRSP